MPAAKSIKEKLWDRLDDHATKAVAANKELTKVKADRGVWANQTEHDLAIAKALAEKNVEGGLARGLATAIFELSIPLYENPDAVVKAAMQRVRERAAGEELSPILAPEGELAWVTEAYAVSAEADLPPIIDPANVVVHISGTAYSLAELADAPPHLEAVPDPAAPAEPAAPEPPVVTDRVAAALAKGQEVVKARDKALAEAAKRNPQPEKPEKPVEAKKPTPGGPTVAEQAEALASIPE